MALSVRGPNTHQVVFRLLAPLCLVASLLLSGCVTSISGEERTPRADTNNCPHDRHALLSLDLRAFDQDMDGGWRELARSGQCQGVAADLIRDYRAHHRSQTSILFWHEGQLRAMLGQTDEALALFAHSRNDDDRFGWNYYVTATIAFLRNDIERLRKARDELASVRPPPSFNPKRSDGTTVAWPPNLNIVDGLIRCFGRSYGEAYSPACNRPKAKGND